MDPNKALDAIRKESLRFSQSSDPNEKLESAELLVDLFDELDEHLSASDPTAPELPIAWDLCRDVCCNGYI